MKRSVVGFTLIEIIITLGVFIVLSGIVLVNITGQKSLTDITNTSAQIVATLRQAQSDSMAQKNGVSWGVHFSNATNTTPFYALFTTSYSPTTTVGYYPLPASVAYNTSSLASGATLDILFSQLSGAASASTSILLYMPKQSTAVSSTISIGSSGVVSY
jgi:type II secretory pathway pseudopilin PulG